MVDSVRARAHESREGLLEPLRRPRSTRRRSSGTRASSPISGRSSCAPASTPAVRRTTSSSSMSRRATTRSGGARSTTPSTPTRFEELHRRMASTCRARTSSCRTATCGADPELPDAACASSPSPPGTASSSATCSSRADPEELADFAPEFTVIALPAASMPFPRSTARTARRLHPPRLRASGSCSSAGPSYAGEIKKSIFTVDELPAALRRACCPCTARPTSGQTGDVALFFGLSRHRQDDAVGRPRPGADRRRRARLVRRRHLQLRGRLLRQGHPPVRRGRAGDLRRRPAASARSWRTSAIDWPRGGSISTTTSLTENTRAAYPICAHPQRRPATGRAGHPQNVIFLTADAFGVLPPIAKLTPEQAMYHFISGYTAKVAGTERGINEPKATFSAPASARPSWPCTPRCTPSCSARRSPSTTWTCWLVNTGWTGGAYAAGRAHQDRVLTRA